MVRAKVQGNGQRLPRSGQQVVQRFGQQCGLLGEPGKGQAVERRLGQPAGGGQGRELLFARPASEQVIDGLLAQLELLQTVQGKGFALRKHGAVAVHTQPEDPGEEEVHRVAPETHQLGEFHLFLFLLGRRVEGDAPEGRRRGLPLRRQPGAVVAGAGGRAGETAAAEGLHRVFAGQQLTGGPVATGAAGGEVVEQFADHRRGRADRVVAQAAAHPGDGEHVAGAEQGLEEQVAVVAAPVAVARTRGLGHQVERGRALGAREGGVVHAQEPEHPEGHRAHGHHVGEGDPAAQEGLTTVRLGQCPFQVLADRLGRKRSGAAGQAAVPLEGGDRLAQGRQPLVVPVREKEGVKEAQEQPVPVGRGTAAAEERVPPVDGVHEGDEAAERSGLAAAGGGAGQEPLPGFVARTHEMAEQQPVQAEPPAMRAGGGHTQFAAVVRVQPPADAGSAHPLVQPGQHRRVQVEAGEQGVVLAQGEHLGPGAAAGEQGEQVEAAADQRLPLARALVGERPGNALVGCGGAEHAGDGPGVQADVGRGHEDVSRGEPGQGLEQVEQPVVEHLHLAQRRAAGVQLHGAIVRPQDEPLLAGPGAVVEVEDVVLQGGEQVRPRALGVAVDVLRAEFDQLAEKVAPGPAERQQQGIAAVVQVVIGLGTGAAPGRGQLSGRTQVRPVVAAGAEVEQVDLGAAAELGDDLQVDRRQGVEPEQKDALRQVDGVIGTLEQLAAALTEQGAQGQACRGESPPEQGLPVLVAPLALPLAQQVRSEDQVLIEHLADPFGQLQELAAVRVVRQIGGEFGEQGVVEAVRQEADEAPAEHRPGEQVLLGRAAAQPLQQFPDKAAGQGKVEVGGDAGGQGRLAGEPLGHALVGHNDALRPQGVCRRLLEHGEQMRKKDFQPVGLMDEHSDRPP